MSRSCVIRVHFDPYWYTRVPHVCTQGKVCTSQGTQIGVHHRVPTCVCRIPWPNLSQIRLLSDEYEPLVFFCVIRENSESVVNVPDWSPHTPSVNPGSFSELVGRYLLRVQISARYYRWKCFRPFRNVLRSKTSQVLTGTTGGRTPP